MATYDFFIAGRWRNKAQVQSVLDAVRGAGKLAYCFLENTYKGEKVEFGQGDDPQTAMRQLESLPQNDSLVQKIFTDDMRALRNSEALILVLPAGKSGHIEAGVAYGLNKKCYGVGPVEQTETLYGIFDQLFPTVPALTAWLEGNHG